MFVNRRYQLANTLKICSYLALIYILSACQSHAQIDSYHQMQSAKDDTLKNPQSETAQKSQRVSGFLSDYSKLSKTKGTDDEPVLRWISPELTSGQFKKIKLNPITIYPIRDQAVEISATSQQEIKQYLDAQLRQKLGAIYQITEQASEDVAQIRIAITAIELSAEGMKVTEALPYGAVIGLVRTATGTRNQEVSVAVEMEVVNSVTHQPILALVRVGQGENIRMLWDANFSLQHVQGLLDKWVELAVKGFHKVVN